MKTQLCMCCAVMKPWLRAARPIPDGEQPHHRREHRREHRGGSSLTIG
jgi:hypothetical protein